MRATLFLSIPLFALAAQVNLTVYHINPLAFPGAPINMDLGDLDGDVFFDILTIASTFACKQPSGGIGKYLVCDNQEVVGHDIGVTS